jgi:hypothetical protein
MTPELPAIREIWLYLSSSPLLALILTLGAYQCGVLVYERADRHPMANPVAIAVIIVATTITGIDMPYAKYFEGAQFVHFLLGSATVALAVPIYKGLAALRGRVLPLLAALFAGAATSIVSAVGIARDRHVSRLQRASGGGYLREHRDGHARRARRRADTGPRSLPAVVIDRKRQFMFQDGTLDTAKFDYVIGNFRTTEKGRKSHQMAHPVGRQ